MKRTTTRKPPRQPHHADDLSFMRRRKPRGQGGGIDYWVVEPTGNYVTDCETGHNLAKEYLAYIAKHPTVGNAYLLSCIVHDMVDQAATGKKWSGIHGAFLHDVNHHAMAMAAALIRAESDEQAPRKAA